jgi:hypothetical protein
MVSPLQLLTAAYAVHYVARRYQVPTIEMDLRVCPKPLRWPRALIMTLAVNAGLGPDEIGRLFNCPSGVVVEACAWVKWKTERDPDLLGSVTVLIRDFERALEQREVFWMSLPVNTAPWWTKNT